MSQPQTQDIAGLCVTQHGLHVHSAYLQGKSWLNRPKRWCFSRFRTLWSRFDAHLLPRQRNVKDKQLLLRMSYTANVEGYTAGYEDDLRKLDMQVRTFRNSMQ